MQLDDGDTILWQKVKHGDEHAFEQLFRRYYAILVVHARKILPDKDSSENIVQSLFVKLWERREGLNISSVYSYMVAAVKNSCLNELKRSKQEKLYNMFLVDHADEIDSVTINEEMIKRVQNVISQMPSQRQKIFRLNRFDGLKYKEIAVRLEISIKTVEAQMSKALKFLREKLPKEILTSS